MAEDGERTVPPNVGAELAQPARAKAADFAMWAASGRRGRASSEQARPLHRRRDRAPFSWQPAEGRAKRGDSAPLGSRISTVPRDRTVFAWTALLQKVEKARL